MLEVLTVFIAINYGMDSCIVVKPCIVTEDQNAQKCDPNFRTKYQDPKRKLLFLVRIFGDLVSTIIPTLLFLSYLFKVLFNLSGPQ